MKISICLIIFLTLFFCCVIKLSSQEISKNNTNLSLSETEIKPIQDKYYDQSEIERKLQILYTKRKIAIDSGEDTMQLDELISNLESQKDTNTDNHQNIKQEERQETEIKNINQIEKVENKKEEKELIDIKLIDSKKILENKELINIEN